MVTGKKKKFVRKLKKGGDYKRWYTKYGSPRTCVSERACAFVSACVCVLLGAFDTDMRIFVCLWVCVSEYVNACVSVCRWVYL